MAISKQQFSNYIKAFEFRQMFNDMGWDNDTTTAPIVVDAISYELKAVARKSGFKILLCNSANGNIADYSTRKKIETKVTKSFQEHLLIFTDAKKQEQIWQLVVRHSGKPAKTTETRYHISQDPELLYQRAAGIFFELDEEEHINIIDVTKRVTENFHQNNERVTKQFYDRFKQQHTAFLKFIKGIDDKVNQEWYASLMLNRLMFCYFIQKKGFLDNNKNYLSDKLKECQQKKGKDKFYSFYRNFLLHLFHDGLGAPDHSKNLITEIGNIPYLNGGLFDEHELEKNHSKIEIDDKAFESIFKFFNEWEWHLDTRHTASGKDINPDVIGYIFEKYINDRADMGAYYTKEDITDYISKNCILPFLFDETKRELGIKNYELRIKETINGSGDRYIYDAVKRGVGAENFLPLPDSIAAGINDVSKRTEWNKPAPNGFSLPTEIWREVVDRRNRYTEIKTKIEKGEVTSINDFITYNLNIRQFAIDTIANTNDPDFLKAFYKSLNSVTIIDPTCGSGAFLFAAMNILEELYEQCIQRMQNFVSDAPKGKFKFFEETIAQVTAPEHPNLQYFIYKNIILRNLYGVDIMKEAVEIAKLRLFLKLVATVEANYKKENLGLEPLPDIDFNIRSGNTLVGFATEKELETGSLDFQGDKKKVLEEMEKVSMAFERFKSIQLSGDKIDYKDFKSAKDNYLKQLNKLKDKLNHSYFNSFGDHKKGFEKWLESHLPFHWFAEFYEIVQNKKGFDIIIGNPPYVEYSKMDYKLNGFKTIKCGNLYPFVIERSFSISSKNGRIGMIVPISSICTDRMVDYQKLLLERNCWNSLYAERPSKLFSGAEVQLVISLFSNDTLKNIYSSTYNKWGSAYRDFLFENIGYAQITNILRRGSCPKTGSEIEKAIILKINLQKKSLNNFQINSGKHFVSYRNAGGRYYKVILNYEPIFKVNKEHKRSSTYQFLYFEKKEIADSVCALMNSSLFFWYWLIYSDTWHMVNREIGSFPIVLSDSLIKNLSSLNKNLMKDLASNSSDRKENRNKGLDVVEFTQFNVRESKPIIDEIDTALAEHYGFTEEELDFIINYDIKYRMGKELETGEDE